jgi:hypothetical protein
MAIATFDDRLDRWAGSGHRMPRVRGQSGSRVRQLLALDAHKVLSARGDWMKVVDVSTVFSAERREASPRTFCD